MKRLKGFLTLLAVGVMATFQWGCSNTTTTSTTNNNNGIPMSSLFPFASSMAAAGGSAGTQASNNMSNSFSTAFNPVFSNVALASGGTGSWAIGIILGVNEDTTQIGGSTLNAGYGMVALSVGNQAVSTAGVTLTPNGGSAIALSYLASSSYNGYNYSLYAAGTTVSPTIPSYLAGTSYTMNVATSGGTSSSSLTAPGGFTYGYNSSNGGVTTTVSSLGTVNAAFVAGISGANYSANENTSAGSPFYNGSWYGLSSPVTYYSVYDSTSWTTSMTSTAGLKGGLIGMDIGIAISAH